VRYTGVRMNTLDLSLRPKQEVTANWGVMGITSPAPTTAIISGATYAPATATDIFNAGLNVAALSIASTSLVRTPKIQALDLRISNNLYEIDAVGQYYPYSHGLGRFDVTGTITALFENFAMLSAIMNHEDVALGFTLQDAIGNSLAFSIPKVKLTDGGAPVPGNNQPVIVAAPFQAYFDSGSSA